MFTFSFRRKWVQKQSLGLDRKADIIKAVNSATAPNKEIVVQMLFAPTRMGPTHVCAILAIREME